MIAIGPDEIGWTGTLGRRGFALWGEFPVVTIRRRYDRRRYPMETIIFLRHGQAEDDDGRGDAARPLTRKGIAQSEVAGRALNSLGLIPDLCLSSPRTRAIETARGACEALGLEPVVDEGLGIGEFDAEDLAAGLGCVLLVGHEPSFSSEVGRLTGGSVRLRKGGIAVVRGSRLEMLAGPDLLALAS